MDAQLDLSTLVPGQAVRMPGLGEAIWLGTNNRDNHVVQIDKFELPKVYENPLLRPAKHEHKVTTLMERLLKSPEFFLQQGYTLGSDPEMFVVNAQGEVIPAWEFLPAKPERGDKQKPEGEMSMEPMYHGKPSKHRYHTTVYWDGFQAEFALGKASHCLQMTTDNIRAGLLNLFIRAQKHDPESKLSIENTVKVKKETLLNAQDVHVRFGCKPSFNVYNDVGDDPGDGRELEQRFAGGHWHFGLSFLNPHEIEHGVKALDAVLGVAAVSLAEGIDVPIRRKFYGLPGEFRLPKHGLEYRVLSNFWLTHPAVCNLVWGLGRRALTFGKRGLLPLWTHQEERTKEIIKNCDVQGARKVLEQNSALLKALLPNELGMGFVEKAYKFILTGVRGALPNYANIEQNWRLKGDWEYGCESPECTWSSFAAGLRI